MFGLSLATIKLIVYAIIAAVLLGGVAYVKHEWDAGQAARHQVAARAAQDRAVAASEKIVVSSAAAQEKTAQAALAAQTVVIVKRIPVYVSTKAPPAGHPAVGCITYGLLRLHDAAVLGVSPDDLPAAGQLDDACSPVAPSDFASTIARNYAAARANAEQLDALEADIREQAHAAGGPPVVAQPPPPLAVDVPY